MSYLVTTIGLRYIQHAKSLKAVDKIASVLKQIGYRKIMVYKERNDLPQADC